MSGQRRERSAVRGAVRRPQSRLAGRKADHVRLAAEGTGEVGGSAWGDVHLIPQAVPAVDPDDVDTRVDLLGASLRLPLMIAGMTGGHQEATRINAALAAGAEACGCAMGVGSQRAALRSARLASTYSIAREEAPHAFLVANIGLPQLLPREDGTQLRTEDVLRLIEMIRADALAIHLNYLQECVQPEGQPQARGAMAALRRSVRATPVPVIAKETGAGMTRASARALRAAGVACLDVGGRGGTSFALIEARRAHAVGMTDKARLGQIFAEWGVPTAVAVVETARVGLPVIATGGIRSGLDGARALALGATLVGVARPLLSAALVGESAVIGWIRQFELELRTAMFLAGARSIADLRGRTVVTGSTAEWLRDLA